MTANLAPFLRLTCLLSLPQALGCLGAGAGDPDSNRDDPGKLDEPGEVNLLACTGEEDRDRDGTVDGYWSFSYDDQGRETAAELDADGDDATDTVLRSEYRTSGQLTRFAVDYDNNRTIDSVYEATYDEDGRLLEDRWDANGDGVFEEVTTRTYSEQELATREVVKYGELSRFETYVYRAPGRIERVDVDTTGDSEIDTVDTYNYNSSGKIEEIATDVHIDGVVDVLEYRFYTDHSEDIHYDRDADGYGERFVRRRWDDEGRLVSLSIDRVTPSDSHSIEHRLVYDAAGRLELFEVFDEDGTGSATTYLYDDCGDAASSAPQAATLPASVQMAIDHAGDRL